MNEIKLKVFELGPLYANCYLMYSPAAKKAVIIDAPEGVECVLEFIRKLDLTLEYALITHGHFDHIGGLDRIDVPFYIHPIDGPALSDSRRNGSAYFSHPIAIKQTPLPLEESTQLSFQDSPFKILHTPGHSPGAVSILYKRWLFSGDTIFFGSIGRTDIPLANHEDLMASIEGKILTLPGDTIIYPGHGSTSTVEREKINNPYLI